MKRIFRVPQRTWCRLRQPAGFTLVELLVATGLIVLMMSLFAQVFQMAGGSISTQRGIMENDQRSRTLDTVIRSDLRNRTFKLVLPLAPGEESDQIDFRPDLRQGYFYISENDPNDPTDDVLKFTARATTSSDALDRYSGRATPVGTWPLDENQPERDDGSLETNFTGQTPVAEVMYFMRRGAEAGPVSTGRPGCLYRRVMLLRTPPKSFNTQPATLNNTQLFVSGGPYFTAGGNAVSFWNDFDYSASLDEGLAPLAVRFNGLDSLANGSTGLSPVQMTPLQFVGPYAFPPTIRFASGPIAIPHFRFGHDRHTGRPLEFLQNSSANRRVFIGGFVAEETSFVNDTSVFGYPAGRDTANRLPMSQSSAYNTLDTLPANASSIDVVPDYRGGSRRGEDLLMSNVHEFDIKVWDEVAGDWVDIGHEQATPPVNVPFNDYSQARNDHYRFDGVASHVSALGAANYGPGTIQVSPAAASSDRTANRVFDTWYHRMPWNAGHAIHPPPFRPQRFRWLPTANAGQPAPRPTTWTANQVYRKNDLISDSGSASDPILWVAVPATGAVGTSSTGVSPFATAPTSFLEERTRIPASGTPDGSMFWQMLINTNSQYADPSGNLPPLAPNWRASWDNGGTWTPQIYAVGDVVFPDPVAMQGGRPFVYRCVGVRDTTGETLNTPNGVDGEAGRQPPTSWPRTPGIEFWEDGDGIAGEVRWRCESNNKPLRAIQIRLRYMDPTTQQMRNQTIVQSLMDFRTTTSTAAAP